MKLIDPREILEYEQSKRDSTQENLLVSERRIGELSDEFTRLEVQIATILFAFMGFFTSSFGAITNPTPSVAGTVATIVVPLFSPMGTSFVKITIAFVFFFLMLSLSFGLVHIKRKEFWWCGMMERRVSRHLKWEAATTKDVTIEQAIEYHAGTTDGTHISSSPKWTWVLQTISLGIAVLGIFTLLMVFLFH